MDVLEISKKILHEGPVCDNCLGRQFAKLSTGLSNRERGQALKLALALEGDRINKEINDKIIHQFYTLESIFYHDEKDMCEKINKIRKDKGTQ